MKRFLPLAALLLAAPLVAAPRPWTAVATPVADGSYAIGNPKARVTLTEYVSYTCPHCAHYRDQSAATVNAWVRSGALRVEVRSQIHDKFDLAAATLARCAGPARFPALHDALFARQREWVERGIAWDEANGARMNLYPQLAKLRAAVAGAGLDEVAQGVGMSAAALDACFADDRALNATLAANKATAGVRGTPAFAINGRMVDAPGWTQLQPLLRAAGAK